MTTIAHFSMPANDPKRSAAVLAEMMGGEALPFPPGGIDSWMAWSNDGAVEIEITRRGLVLAFGSDQVEWRSDGVARELSDAHIALCIECPAAEVIAIATRAGWPARRCVRGGNLFDLTEVWVEGAFLIEVLDPVQTARYRAVVTPTNWKHLLGRPRSQQSAPDS